MTQKIRPLQCRHIKQTLNLKAILEESLKFELWIKLIGERYQKYKQIHWIKSSIVETFIVAKQ